MSVRSTSGRSADYKAAIRQNTILRYETACAKQAGKQALSLPREVLWQNLSLHYGQGTPKNFAI
jgi:hypothetical protein